MSRNGSGTMVIPNTFTPSTTISSSAVNANFTDVGSEITNSLALDGQSTMTGQLKAADGTISAPGIGFGSDTNTGFYRSASGTVKFSADGTNSVTISASGLTIDAGTLGGTGVVQTAAIADSSITTAKLANVNVTTAKIADAAVTTDKIADSAITTGKIADGAVGTADIANSAVTLAKLSTTGTASSSNFLRGDGVWTAGVLNTATTGSPAYYGARCWVQFNGDGGATVNASANVSGVVRNSTGDYTITFSTAMPDTYYSAQISVTDSGGKVQNNGIIFAKTTTTLRVRTGFNNEAASGLADNSDINVVVFR